MNVKGDILSLKNPASTWLSHFKPIEKFDVGCRSSSDLDTSIDLIHSSNRKLNSSPSSSARM